MEHIIVQKKRGPHPFKLEAFKLAEQNRRLDNLNDALVFVIKTLTLSAVGLIWVKALHLYFGL